MIEQVKQNIKEQLKQSNMTIQELCKLMRKDRRYIYYITDERFRYVEVECGHCFECRKKKRREWRIRNYEQLKETPHAVFFTGTVSPQRYEYICKKIWI